MSYFILNVTVQPASHSDIMETSECFMFGNICACITVIGNIGKYNHPSILDLIVRPLGNFTLIIFVVSCTLLRWEDTVMKFPVHSESATAEFSCSIFFLFFVVGAREERLLHTYAFSMKL